MNYINLATMDGQHRAEHLAELLGQKGIRSRIHDESGMQRFIFFTKPEAFSIVQVPEDDYVAAVSFIQHLEDIHESVCDHIFSCPDCGSLAVEYPQFTRKYFITPLLLEWAGNLGLFEKQFYCRKCHSMWPHVTGAPVPKISHAAEVLVSPPN